MKEIEFRAWDKKKRKLSNPVIIFGEDSDLNGSADHVFVGDINISEDPRDFDIEDNNFIWMQFLGRTDRFGKKLFEGDIIKHWRYGRESDETEDYIDTEPEILLIESLEGFFKHLGYCVPELDEEWESKDIEIIGNKFQDQDKIPKEKRIG